MIYNQSAIQKIGVKQSMSQFMSYVSDMLATAAHTVNNRDSSSIRGETYGLQEECY
jgi:hypothetical protein